MDKSWYQSKAVWGGIIAVLAAIAGALGYQVAEGDQQQLIEAVTGIAGAVGGVLAVYGRIRAEGRIK